MDEDKEPLELIAAAVLRIFIGVLIGAAAFVAITAVAFYLLDR